MPYTIAGDDGHGLSSTPTAGKRTPPFPNGLAVKGKMVVQPGQPIYENQFNKEACKYFLEACKRQGFNAIETAPGDQDWPLNTRTKRAKDAKADVMVSFHYNAGGGTGYEIFHHTTASSAAKRLAKCIHDRMIKGRMQRDRGVKAHGFAVCNEKSTGCPAVLIECGFMDDPAAIERTWMLDPDFQKECGEEACQGVCDFLGVKYIPETVAKTPTSPTTPTPTASASSGGSLILLKARTTLNQAMRWAKAKGATAQFISLAELYWKLAPLAGVDPAGAYAQAAKETAYGKFNGVVPITHKNLCGLKIREGGDDHDPKAHAAFATWEIGVQAHIDHSALYAGAPGYPKSITPDPRHFAYLKGTATTFEQFGGKWGGGPTYGKEIVAMIKDMRDNY